MTRYEDDRAQWSDEQIAALQSGDWAALDVPMLVRLLNGQTPQDVVRHLRKLLAALLKWMACPSRRNGGWSGIISWHRHFLRDIFEDDPPMREHAAAGLQGEYELAVYRAASAIGIDPEDLPARCPWNLEQIIDSEFMPGAPATPDDYERAYSETGL
ncbi:hypothetical protein LMG28727_02932 [Paraburkholderia kirstenboschensis]|uniref:DUF29 family protein n=1 Tax=Paraburkholderia kirstenboschensis TaxID=1245436 RepID=UPI000AC1BD57|nr:DUF29 family protein [Paraburkholderia kirstenboschensis]CAD6532407.1 hypothetical protein LMG28727_02932 [Paraburkholderia kirstenboschensis]